MLFDGNLEQNKIISKTQEADPQDTILKSGTYVFDIAFAEWQGASMGEKVTVKIYGDSVKVIYEGEGNLTNTYKGKVIDKGKIRKHKSGVWIISKKESDKDLFEVGGCTGGPSVIEFKAKKFWLC